MLQEFPSSCREHVTSRVAARINAQVSASFIASFCLIFSPYHGGAVQCPLLLCSDWTAENGCLFTERGKDIYLLQNIEVYSGSRSPRVLGAIQPERETDHSHLVPKLRIHGIVTPLIYVYGVVLNKAHGQIYFFIPSTFICSSSGLVVRVSDY